MDALLDSIWLQIIIAIDHAMAVMDALMSPINAALGPAAAIMLLVIATVALTRFFSKRFTTKRYQSLQAEFQHWHSLRQEAIQCEDPEKGKALARNIDQAKLNRVYYDYFFEGLMINIITKYLPVLVMMAYVNEAYRPAKLSADYGREALFQLPSQSGEPLMVGALVWFVACLLTVHLAWWALRTVLNRRASHHTAGADENPQPAKENTAVQPLKTA
jgi:hypothetical protein